MSKLIIQGQNFEGPFLISQPFNKVPGVYVIYTDQKVIDVGETVSLGDRISSHERKVDWIQNANGFVLRLVFKNIPDQISRLNLEKLLRLSLKPCCGDR